MPPTKRPVQLTEKGRRKRLQAQLRWTLITVTVGIPTILYARDHQEGFREPFLIVWNVLPAPLQDFLATSGSLLIATLMMLAAAVVVLHILQNARHRASRGRANVVYIAAGTFAAFAINAVRNLPRFPRAMVSLVAVRSVEDQQGPFEEQRRLPSLPPIWEATVKKGLDPESSAAYHNRASRKYIPWVKQTIRDRTGVIVPILSLGGQTAPNVFRTLLPSLRGEQTIVPWITGRVPRSITIAMTSEDVYARGRAFARSTNSHSNSGKFTDGQPSVVMFE